ncbi:hypothetical protein E4U46_006263 [Claviceps purpurea]|nr:hypothetical protein E4U46_006263 [Claviceps purpurea]
MTSSMKALESRDSEEESSISFVMSAADHLFDESPLTSHPDEPFGKSTKRPDEDSDVVFADLFDDGSATRIKDLRLTPPAPTLPLAPMMPLTPIRPLTPMRPVVLSTVIALMIMKPIINFLGDSEIYYRLVERLVP